MTAGGFAMKNLSVVGNGYHSEEKVVGFYSTGDRIKFWGSRGAFWGGFWGLFFGGLFLALTGDRNIGILMGGPYKYTLLQIISPSQICSAEIFLLGLTRYKWEHLHNHISPVLSSAGSDQFGHAKAMNFSDLL